MAWKLKDEVYNTSAWKKLRASVLRRDAYLCQPCFKAGRITAAVAVDHVIGKAKGGTDALSNLRAICSRCHDAKTAADRGYQPRIAYGPDGNPLP